MTKLAERSLRAAKLQMERWRSIGRGSRITVSSPNFRLAAKKYTWALVTVSAATVAFVSGSSLTIGPFPIGGKLYLYYLSFSLAVIALLHGIFFSVNIERYQRTGKTLSRNVPRYLEYAYALLLSLGLAQVYFQPRQFSEFIDYTTGSDEQIVARIKKQAADHVAGGCKKNDPYFPPSYCAKLRVIASPASSKEYLLRDVAGDADFLNHVIEVVLVPGPPGRIDLVSPIRTDINRLLARREFGAAHDSIVSGRLFNWVMLLLLPVGIGLRVLKTSLELFGRLE